MFNTSRAYFERDCNKELPLSGNIYEAWRLISKADREPPKARIPLNYHIPEAAPLYGLSMSLADLNLGHWLGGNNCGTPSAPVSQVHSSSYWGGAPSLSNSQIPSYLPRSHYSSLVT
ncbi:hypothetical protein SK128_017295 [Halocaridina rubra]|uniref:Uncharacterized protein n=1 Tax=Halocaridina rubra TaxID=373956 RepID=A0AAN8XCU0_HALRR